MPQVDAIIYRWYAGELGGEALFTELARRATPDEAHKWLALAQLEARVASRLTELLSARGLPMRTPDEVARRARERCNALAGKSWSETMQWLRTLAGDALQRMRAEAGQLPQSLAAMGELMLRHEMALMDFAQLELAGDGAQSLHTVTSLAWEKTTPG
jgi:hypothetical protein